MNASWTLLPVPALAALLLSACQTYSLQREVPAAVAGLGRIPSVDDVSVGPVEVALNPIGEGIGSDGSAYQGDPNSARRGIGSWLRGTFRASVPPGERDGTYDYNRGEYTAEPPTPQVVSGRALAVDSGIVKIHYATLRKWTGSRTQPRWFGHEVKSGKDPLNYGTCIVTIPKERHKPGNVEKYDFTHFVFERDPNNTNNYVVVHHPRQKSKEEFGNDIFSEVGRRQDKEVLIFVHGFNNTFDDAASRLAVLVYDMNFNGVPILYSWTSLGGGPSIQSYDHDQDQVEHAAKSFPRFLEWVSSIARAAGAERVNVVAHSMGNRILVQGLTKLAEHHKTKLVNEVVMAAPDVLRQRFEENYLEDMSTVAGRVTLYASNRDWPLAISKYLHKNPRIGQVPPEGAFVAEGLDTVDASNVDFSRFGLNHSYFGGPTVVKDLRKVLHDGLPPVQRKLRRKPVIGALVVWTF